MFRKISLILAIITSVFMFCGYAFASESAPFKSITLSPGEYESKIIEDKGIQEITIKNGKKFLEKTGYDIPHNCKDVEVIIQKPLNDKKTNNTIISDTTAQATGYTIIPYGYTEQVDYGNLLGKTAGSTGTLTLSISKTISAKYSCTVSVSAQVISSAVGFDVTSSYTVTNSCSADTNGRYTEIRGYPIYGITDYEVYYNGVYKGYV
jgi:hypothetical protein